MVLLASILYGCYSRDTSPTPKPAELYKMAQMDSHIRILIGLLLLQHTANVIRRSRQVWIKIKRDHPMRLVFYQAMAALQ
jgi:hypothetical protein